MGGVGDVGGVGGMGGTGGVGGAGKVGGTRCSRYYFCHVPKDTVKEKAILARDWKEKVRFSWPCGLFPLLLAVGLFSLRAAEWPGASGSGRGRLWSPRGFH